jgi:hypothetical protein
VNKFDRNDAFNSEGIRKAMADIKVKPSLEGADGKPVVEMSRLARQTANRLSQENYSPTMIIGIAAAHRVRLAGANRVFVVCALCRPSSDVERLSTTSRPFLIGSPWPCC